MSQGIIACHAQVWTGDTLLEEAWGGPAGRLVVMGEPEHSWSFSSHLCGGEGDGAVVMALV